MEISFDYKMIVLKMIRKIPDGGSYTINLEHPNSQKFIETVKLIMDEKWITKFKKAFNVYFTHTHKSIEENGEIRVEKIMNKIRKVDFPRRGIWQDYFDRREEQNKLQAEILKPKPMVDTKTYTEHKLKGVAESREVWLDGEWLDPKPSQEFTNHSPDGFNWGYAGSGPSQLSLAIMIKLTGKSDGYHDFKYDVISKIPQGEDFEITFKI